MYILVTVICHVYVCILFLRKFDYNIAHLKFIQSSLNHVRKLLPHSRSRLVMVKQEVTEHAGFALLYILKFWPYVIFSCFNI